MNGIAAAVAIRREFPRLPVVFYSIQDDDAYYRAFQRSGILSHYAYVRKSNYLLPQMIVPLIRDALAGRSFIDPDIESRVQEGLDVLQLWTFQGNVKARAFYERRGFTAAEFTDGEGNEERLPDVRYEWRRGDCLPA